MAKFLKSRTEFPYALPELKLPGGKVLPAVELPRAHYRPGELYIRGPRRGMQAKPIFEFNDEEVERIKASPQIQMMIAQGQYEWLDDVPESMRTPEDLVAELRAENEKLKAQNAELKAKAAGTAAPGAEATGTVAVGKATTAATMRVRSKAGTK